ncbi:phage/plasmid primase, P4 family [Pygmaiobacter massiliensis]|uniref:phage/plasmid primase, P4 family n=1 Tax=Pygmaiobacter massiliensis TaxID=1917873 RepID=UPI002A8294DF|nr:phage/plasmid primase, P4 family [Pygmaiobacter massiliensis]MDY4785106.1 phage/plasmid primase, P4 family [Pygmaiobacter massiliensis]
MTALNIPPDEFLKPFFDAGETVCLRVFADRKGTPFQGLKLECDATKIGGMVDTLKKHNAQNRGIFFVVNYGGHEDSDITRINAQFVECDTLPVEEQMARIGAFPLPPSIIVRTKKSLHTYWLVKGAEVPRFRTVQRALIAQFDGDRACINESRVLRLPGFNHCKGEPFMVQCVKFAPELRYTQDELLAALPSVEETISVPAPQGNRKGLQTVLRRCDFLQHCREHASTLPELDWYAMITNLAVFEGGADAIHALSKAYPGYLESETQQKIAHFLESGTKPMTCKTIGEKGFRCPRQAECGCKAPAALCYLPLTVEELRTQLAQCPVAHAPVDDMRTAKEFISANLYNVEPVVAEAFLNYEVKAHFALKAGDMKPLLALHRELYKQYAESREVKRAQFGQELPEWYEPTERGGLHFLPGILADHMAKTVEAFYGAGSYFFYSSGVYAACEDLVALAKVREFMIPRYATMTAITDTVGQWRMLIRKAVREINCNPFLINVKNGLYNVLDDSFKPHTPEYFGTVQISATYNPAASCPEFLRFLGSVLAPEEIYLVQEILGYLLIPVNKAQKSFVFVGAPNAGKSSLLSVAQDILLGSENVSNIPWQSLGDRFNKAELFGKLANIFADLPSKNIDDNGMFKALTGEDYITAERKNKDPFSFRPYARLLFSCNEIPKNYGDRSDGFYRRLIIIRFDHSVPASRRDPNLQEKLSVERDGILMWALEGLKRLIANSYVFTETERTRAELARYKVESNSVLSFVEECCLVDADAETVREELFSRYKEYCANAGLKPLSQANFNKEIENMAGGVTRSVDRLGKRRTWRGIKLC